MNSKQGIGLPNIFSNVTIKSVFSLAWTPPYSVLRNEVMVMDIGVFNSLNQNQNVVYTILKQDGFEAVDLATHGWKGKDIDIVYVYKNNNNSPLSILQRL